MNQIMSRLFLLPRVQKFSLLMKEPDELQPEDSVPLQLSGSVSDEIVIVGQAAQRITLFLPRKHRKAVSLSRLSSK